MDEKVEEITAELLRNKQADNSLFYFGRNADFSFLFTRKPKALFAPYSTSAPFTDAGSFQSRKYFTRSDYIIQNPVNGGMQIRGQQPRIRYTTVLN
tara:strand:- start:7712 stop:7999 length:288 start_codon:yes stop_codon:yes gene_type:complete